MTKSLEIIIDPSKDQVVFAGSTFLLKDRIKALPGARWNFKDKFWYAPLSENSIEALRSLFPGASLIDLANGVVPSNVEGAEDYLGVSKLINNLKAFFDKSFPDDFKVCGVVRGLKSLSQGRVYFDLYDLDNPSIFIRSVIWENRASYLAQLKKEDFVLENDLPVLVSGKVSFSSTNAGISFVVSKIFPEYTKGKLAAEREKTNNRLKQEGIFLKNKSLILKNLPTKLGILTSKGGTVINDFISSLSEAKFGFQLIWYPVRVQGQGAVLDLLSGLSYFNKREDIDAILVFRGGGSVSDLQVFNDYELSKAACLSKKPILSAIGHEFDQCSFQDVSNLAFGVPKDIGHFLANRVKELRAAVLEFKSSIFQCMSLIVERKRSDIILKIDQLRSKSLLEVGDCQNKVLNLQHEIFKKSSDTVIKFSANFNNSCQMIRSLSSYLMAKTKESLRERFYNLLGAGRYACLGRRRDLVEISRPLRGSARRSIDEGERLVSSLEIVFKMVSPELQLERGFAILRSGAKILVSKKQLDINEDLMIELHDGKVRAKVLEVK